MLDIEVISAPSFNIGTLPHISDYTKICDNQKSVLVSPLELLKPLIYLMIMNYLTLSQFHNLTHSPNSKFLEYESNSDISHHLPP